MSALTPEQREHLEKRAASLERAAHHQEARGLNSPALQVMTTEAMALRAALAEIDRLRSGSPAHTPAPAPSPLFTPSPVLTLVPGGGAVPASNSDWTPTHRHVDGGEYRYLGPIAIKRSTGEWDNFWISYDCRDGFARATHNTRWDRRFTPIRPLRAAE